eukprot:Skav232566  [mRNA]  locus=scaffold1594:38842:43705:+ [translate_table: standard]
MFDPLIVSIFVLELLLRVIHLGCQGFCCGVDCAWNIFDAFIVALSVADVMVDYWSKSLANSVAFEEFRVWRTLRFFRVVRGIRIVRIFRYIAALRTLVISIAATMSSLFWTLFLLLRWKQLATGAASRGEGGQCGLIGNHGSYSFGA